MSSRRPSTNASGGADSDGKFGFQSGSDFTLEEFQNYADEFKQQYFGMKGIDEISLSEIKKRKEIWRPSVAEIEGEYWRIVVCPDDEVEVLDCLFAYMYTFLLRLKFVLIDIKLSWHRWTTVLIWTRQRLVVDSVNCLC